MASRNNRTALHPNNQFIVDKFIALERQQQMRGKQKMNFTYSGIIKSLQKYPLPILSRQQALQLENVGEKMANLIYGLLKIEYKDYIKNPFQEFEEALETDPEDVGSKKSSKQNNSNTNGSLFSKPRNSFNSKMVQKEMNSSKDVDEEEDNEEMNDFKDVKKRITGINTKRKITQEEEERITENYFHQVAPRLALNEEDKRQTIEKEDQLTGSAQKSRNLDLILNQYITPSWASVESDQSLNIKFPGGEKTSNNNLFCEPPQNEILQDSEIVLKSTAIEEEDNQEVQRFPNKDNIICFKQSLHNCFQSLPSSKSKTHVHPFEFTSSTRGIHTSNAFQNEDQDEGKESNSNGSKERQQTKNENEQVSKKVKKNVVPRQFSNNWDILISIYCCKQESLKSSCTSKEIRQKGEQIASQLDKNFCIKTTSTIDSLISNDLVLQIVNQSGEKFYSLTEAGLKIAEEEYFKFVSQSVTSIVENPQEHFHCQEDIEEENYKTGRNKDSFMEEEKINVQIVTNRKAKENDKENIDPMSLDELLELMDNKNINKNDKTHQILPENNQSQSEGYEDEDISEFELSKPKASYSKQLPYESKLNHKKKGKRVIEPIQPLSVFTITKIFQAEEDIQNDEQFSRRFKRSDSKKKKRSSIKGNSVIKETIKEYEICLIIDVRERTDRNERMVAFQQKLQQLNVNCKVENIYLGDFLWVVDITTVDDYKETYVLDYIVERKTGDDLAASIQDHRYKEQKYRYKKSGLKHCYYLVEGDVRNNKHLSVQQPAIEAAIMSTQMLEGFKVQRTRTFQESIQWLSLMHKNILSHFHETFNALKDEHALEFAYTMKEYQRKNKKNANLSLKEQFGHILRAVNGSGPQQVASLIEIFKTPINLYSQMAKARNLQERIELIQDQMKLRKEELKASGIEAKSIPKSLATSIAMLFGEEKYPRDKIND